MKFRVYAVQFVPGGSMIKASGIYQGRKNAFAAASFYEYVRGYVAEIH